jgi:hypothetical protein
MKETSQMAEDNHTPTAFGRSRSFGDGPALSKAGFFWVGYTTGMFSGAVLTLAGFALWLVV